LFAIWIIQFVDNLALKFYIVNHIRCDIEYEITMREWKVEYLTC